jgi:TldD protein
VPTILEIYLERRTFLNLCAGTAGAMLVPVFGNAIAAEELQNPACRSASRRRSPTPP